MAAETVDTPRIAPTYGRPRLMVVMDRFLASCLEMGTRIQEIQVDEESYFGLLHEHGVSTGEESCIRKFTWWSGGRPTVIRKGSRRAPSHISRDEIELSTDDGMWRRDPDDGHHADPSLLR